MIQLQRGITVSGNAQPKNLAFPRVVRLRHSSTLANTRDAQISKIAGIARIRTHHRAHGRCRRAVGSPGVGNLCNPSC